MKISELFERLSYGELSNLSLANDGSGTMMESAYPKLIHYTNEALLRLHSRFVLIETSLMLEQVGSITFYPLTADYAETSTSAEDYKYIKDATLETPFQDDVIKILAVNDETSYQFPLNDNEDAASLFTPKPNILQIPIPQNEVMLAVSYQARHPKLPTNLSAANTLLLEFDIPFTLEGALQSYIAYMTYNFMNGVENLNKSVDYRNQYEAICQEIEKQDLVNQSLSLTNVKFTTRGWV